MKDSLKAILWAAAGLGLIAVTLIAGTVLFGDTGEPEGWSLAALVAGFWLVVLAGGILVVRGSLYLLRGLGRRGAVQLAIIAFLAIPLAVVIHNVIYAITGQEEGFFFILALFVLPVVLVAAVVRIIWPAHQGEPPAPPAGSGRLAPRH
jgi:hypothetical protein